MLTNNGKTLKFIREFSVPVENLYKAWADPSLFASWWRGLIVTNMDFRKGGRYRVEWKTAPGHFAEGTYTEIIPNEKIVFTWENYSGANAAGTEGSVVTLNFRKTGPSSSELDLIHDGLPSEADRDNHLQGWHKALLYLAEQYDKQESQPVPAIHISRTVPFSIEKVFEAWTQPKFMNEWFNKEGYTLGKAQCELAVGKSYRLDHQKDNGDVIQHTGQYKEIIPNEKLVFTWLSDFSAYESTVTVLFKKQGSSTAIEITHDGLRTESARKGHTGGWEACLKNLERELTKALNR